MESKIKNEIMDFIHNDGKYSDYVKLVIKSWIDYKNHSVNILRDCLSCWANDEMSKFNSSFKFRTINIDDTGMYRMFFVSARISDLKLFNLDKDVLNNDDLKPQAFMNDSVADGLFINLNDKNAA